jgi:hypothetical protein
MFCRAVNRINVVVTVMEEIAHFVPGTGLGAGVFAAQGLIQRGETFVGLAIRAMQFQKRTRQCRGV